MYLPDKLKSNVVYMKQSIATILLSVLVSAVVSCGVLVGDRYVNQKAETAPEAAPAAAVRPNIQIQPGTYPDFVYAAETAVEAVVYVKVTVRTGAYGYYGSDDPLFDFFFGPRYGYQEYEAQGSGSGVIISPDGYIVTNNHVIEHASRIEVTLNDNRRYEATLVGTDPATDIALLKVDASGLPSVPVGDSDALRLGEWVIAIGSPFDLRSTITAGIVSAKGRTMPNYDGRFRVESFIQTDAAVNPGNSGGALVNTAGELVGINTSIVSNTGSYMGYSFAVPAKIVSRIVSDLITDGRVHRPSLGISMMQLNENIRQELKLSSESGVLIYETVSGSGAQEAGLQRGDLILKFDGTSVSDPSALRVLVNERRPGEVVAIEFERSGKVETVDVTLKEL